MAFVKILTRQLLFLTIGLLLAMPLTAEARQARSQVAKNIFKAGHPCPSNGNRRGSCPGYVIDHVVALACGGADAPYNMQWQSIAEGKAKDGWERKGCQTKHQPSMPPKMVNNTKDYYTGPKGGCFIYTKSAKKRYVNQIYCRNNS
jgi:hypothetical protein